MFTAVLAAVTPLALQQLIDHLATASDRAELAPLWFYLATLLAGRVAAQGQAYTFATGDQALQGRLGITVFGRLLRLPMEFHLTRRPGSLLHAHHLALHGVRILIQLAGFTLLPAIVQMVIILTVLAGQFDALVCLIMAATMLAYAVTFASGARRIASPTKQALASETEAAGLFAEGLVNVEVAKAFMAGDRLEARFAAMTRLARDRWRDCAARRAETGSIVAMVFVVSMGCVLLVGAQGLAAGHYTIGQFVLLNAYAMQVAGPVESTGYAVRDLAQGISYLAGWNEVLTTGPEPHAPDEQGGGASSGGQRAPAISFRNVCFGYEHGRPVLSDLDFDLAAGEALAVVGASGAGKSSLLRLLQRHYLPTSGSILFDGAPAEQVDVNALRRRMAVVAQDTSLFNDTLRQNLLLGDPEADDAMLQLVLGQAGLTGLLERLPDGLDTNVGERGQRLSGGERQRVALARALLRNAGLLILDEPTSGLDNRTEREVSETFLSASRGRTTLLVTHRLSLAARADRTLVLVDGRVAEMGSHVQLIENGGAYARLWHSQDFHDYEAE